MSKRSKLKIGLVLVAAAALFCMLFVLSLSLAVGATASAEQPEQTYTFHRIADVVEYAREYAKGNRNKKDHLEIAINEDSDIIDDTFISIGTESAPFAGELNVSSAGLDVFRLANCPLFNYVSTDMRITGAGMVKIMRKKASSTPSEGVLTSGALFANHVVKGTSSASWTVSLLPYDG